MQKLYFLFGWIGFLASVLVADRQTLEKFLTDWKFHHPLDASQLQFANSRAKVVNVSFYHEVMNCMNLKGYLALGMKPVLSQTMLDFVAVCTYYVW